MSGTAFTKGPWLMAAKPSSVVGWPIVAPQAMGRVICSLNYADPKAFGGRQSGDIAFNRESKANGYLIEAAPELLAALVELVEMERRRYGDSERSQTVFRQINAKPLAALAKARGEQS
jgi:hypothetical protein